MKEKIAIWIAWHLPHDIVKWCMVRVVAHATTGQWGTDHVDSLGYHEFHDRWAIPHAG